jgi:drug/metabolite transporter (DMT)-like permease
MHVIGAACIMLAALAWAVDGVLLRPRLYSLDVPIVVFIEHAVAFSIMLIPFIIEWRVLKTIDARTWGSFFWVALFGGAIGTMAIVKALFLVDFHGLSVIIILQKLQPVFAILLAILVLKEKPKKSFYLWAVIALLGSYLITFGFQKPVIVGNSLFYASMFSLLAAFAFGSSTTFGKRALNKVNYRVATYIRFGLTSLIMLAIIVSLNGWHGFAAVTWQHMMLFLLIAVSTGGLAIFVYYYGLRHVKASQATIYELAFPAGAVLLDFLINKHLMSLPQMLGAALIVGSIIMITRNNN